MRRLMILLCVTLLIAVASAIPAGAAVPIPTVPAANATYTPINFPGADSTHANAINRSGPLLRSVEIVGTYHDIQGTHGFLLSGGHYTKLDVPVPGASDTTPRAINGLHQIVGTYYEGVSGATCNFLYSAGTYTSLPFTSACNFDTPNMVAYGINNAGNVAGGYEDYSDVTPEGTVTTEGFLGSTDGPVLQRHYKMPGARATEIYGLNNNPSHQMVGYYVGNQGFHGVVFTGLNTNGVSFDVPGTSSGTMFRGINDSGQIVGSYDPGPLGFVDDNGSYRTINYPGAQATVANGINNPDAIGNGSYNIVGSYSELAGQGPPDPSHGNYPKQHGFMATVSPVTNRCSIPCRR